MCVCEREREREGEREIEKVGYNTHKRERGHDSYRRIELSGACVYWDNSKIICATNSAKTDERWRSLIGISA